MQISETHLIEGERNKDVFGYLHFSELETKCDGCESRFHIVIIKGEKSACLLTGAIGCEDINQSILGKGAKWLGESFSKRYITVQKKYFGRYISLNSSFLIKRWGELIFCLLTGFLLATLATISICLYSIFLGALFAGCLYFSFLLLKEIVIVCGELETKFRDNMKNGLLFPFFFFRKSIFLLLLITIFVITIIYEIGIYGLNIPNQEAWIRYTGYLAFILGYGFLFALIIPVFAGFGFLLYFLWGDSQTRYGSSFKCSFLEAAPSIEKLSEMAIHSVIFIASAAYLYNFVWNRFGRSTVLCQICSEGAPSIIFFRTLVIGAVITIPFTLFFLYLGKAATNLKAIELAKIDDKLKELSISDLLSSKKKEDIEREKESLLSCRDRVSKSLRWVVGVEYVSRMVLLIFIGLLSKLILG